MRSLHYYESFRKTKPFVEIQCASITLRDRYPDGFTVLLFKPFEGEGHHFFAHPLPSTLRLRLFWRAAFLGRYVDAAKGLETPAVVLLRFIDHSVHDETAKLFLVPLGNK